MTVGAETTTTPPQEDEMERTTTTTDGRKGISVGRAMLAGGSLGGVVVWAATAWVAIDHGIEPAAAAALGAFVGLWGGVGLGGMVAATIPLSRLLPDGSTGP